jgi:LytS/YehU family sensor histidine kinase
VAYACTLLLLFCITIGLHNEMFYLIYRPLTISFAGAAMHNIIPFLFTITVSATYKTISDRMEADQLNKEKLNENLKTELSFLRSQISPHFLFNVLNNITALIRMKSNDLEATVMKLSSLMQYMLYETDEEKVIVKSEAEYLQAYIDLQQQRYGEELSLKVLFDVKEDWHTIEPMLLIPFVENAFKHGGILQHPEIHVSLSVTNNELHFTVKNKFENSMKIKDKTSGIGLSNVKRRLELLYPSKHILKIDQQPGWFIIDLKIILQ